VGHRGHTKTWKLLLFLLKKINIINSEQGFLPHTISVVKTVEFVSDFFMSVRNQTIAMIFSFLRFLNHVQQHDTVGTTPLYE